MTQIELESEPEVCISWVRGGKINYPRITSSFIIAGEEIVEEGKKKLLTFIRGLQRRSSWIRSIEAPSVFGFPNQTTKRKNREKKLSQPIKQVKNRVLLFFCLCVLVQNNPRALKKAKKKKRVPSVHKICTRSIEKPMWWFMWVFIWSNITRESSFEQKNGPFEGSYRKKIVVI